MDLDLVIWAAEEALPLEPRLNELTWANDLKPLPPATAFSLRQENSACRSTSDWRSTSFLFRFSGRFVVGMNKRETAEEKLQKGEATKG